MSAMSAQRAQLPVVIAGAGPVGSLLALYLARRDVPVVLLEKEPELPVDLRASTFHPPSLEMIADLGLGVIDDMLALGLVADRYQYRDRRSGEVANFDMGLIADSTRYPFRLQLEQYEFTRLVNERLCALPAASLRFGCEVTGFAQTADRVEAQVRTPAGDEVIAGAFLVSAEGAHSCIRKAAGIGYLGFTYDEKFLVVSTDFPFEDVFDDLSWVNYVLRPGGMVRHPAHGQALARAVSRLAGVGGRRGAPAVRRVRAAASAPPLEQGRGLPHRPPHPVQREPAGGGDLLSGPGYTGR